MLNATDIITNPGMTSSLWLCTSTGVSTWLGTQWGMLSPALCVPKHSQSDSRRMGGGQSAVPEAQLPTSWDISSTWAMMKTLVSVKKNAGILFQILKWNQNEKPGLGSMIILISQCYIRSPAYKAIMQNITGLLPSVLYECTVQVTMPTATNEEYK